MNGSSWRSMLLILRIYSFLSLLLELRPLLVLLTAANDSHSWVNMHMIDQSVIFQAEHVGLQLPPSARRSILG